MCKLEHARVRDYTLVCKFSTIIEKKKKNYLICTLARVCAYVCIVRRKKII